MGGVGSGGNGRLSVAEHIARGTLRPARHLALATPATPPAPPTRTERREALAGLGPAARTMVARLLDTHGDWDAASLHTLNQYGRSCERLAGLTDDDARHKELRVNLALLRALHLEAPR